MATNHLLRGILLSSKMVPTVAENCRRQSRHLNRVETRFLVLDLRVIRYAPGAPHLGQMGPSGQRGLHEDFPALFGGELEDVDEGAVGEVEHQHIPVIGLTL